MTQIRFHNISNRELVLPNDIRLLPNASAEVDEEIAEPWAKHPVIRAWIDDKWLEAELPEEDDSDYSDGDSEVTEAQLEKMPRSKIVRFLKSQGISARGPRDTLLERAKEALVNSAEEAE